MINFVNTKRKQKGHENYLLRCNVALSVLDPNQQDFKKYLDSYNTITGSDIKAVDDELLKITDNKVEKINNEIRYFPLLPAHLNIVDGHASRIMFYKEGMYLAETFEHLRQILETYVINPSNLITRFNIETTKERFGIKNIGKNRDFKDIEKIISIALMVNGHSSALVVLKDNKNNLHAFIQDSQSYLKIPSGIIRSKQTKKILTDTLSISEKNIHELNIEQQGIMDSNCLLWMVANIKLIESYALKKKSNICFFKRCTNREISDDDSIIINENKVEDIKKGVREDAIVLVKELEKFIRDIWNKEQDKIKRVDVNELIKDAKNKIPQMSEHGPIDYLETKLTYSVILSVIKQFNKKIPFDFYGEKNYNDSSNGLMVAKNIGEYKRELKKFIEKIKNKKESKNSRRTFIIDIGDFNWVTMVVDYQHEKNVFRGFYVDHFNKFKIYEKRVVAILDTIYSSLLSGSSYRNKQIINYYQSIRKSQEYDSGFWAIQDCFDINVILDSRTYLTNGKYPISDLLNGGGDLLLLTQFLSTDSRVYLKHTSTQSGYKELRNDLREEIEKSVKQDTIVQRTSHDILSYISILDVKQLFAVLDYESYEKYEHAFNQLLTVEDNEIFAQELNDFITRNKNKKITKARSTFIIHTGENYWVTLVVNHINNAYQAYYVDSLADSGSVLPDKIRNALEHNKIEVKKVPNVEQQSKEHDKFPKYPAFSAMQHAFDINMVLNNAKTVHNLYDDQYISQSIERLSASTERINLYSENEYSNMCKHFKIKETDLSPYPSNENIPEDNKYPFSSRLNSYVNSKSEPNKYIYTYKNTEESESTFHLRAPLTGNSIISYIGIMDFKGLFSVSSRDVQNKNYENSFKQILSVKKDDFEKELEYFTTSNKNKGIKNARRTFIIDTKEFDWVTLVVDYRDNKYIGYYADYYGADIPESITTTLNKKSINNIKKFISKDKNRNQESDKYNSGFRAIQNAFDMNIILNDPKTYNILSENTHLSEVIKHLTDPNNRIILDPTNDFIQARELLRVNIEKDLERGFYQIGRDYPNNKYFDESPLNKKPKLTTYQDPLPGPSNMEIDDLNDKHSFTGTSNKDVQESHLTAELTDGTIRHLFQHYDPDYRIFSIHGDQNYENSYNQLIILDDNNGLSHNLREFKTKRTNEPIRNARCTFIINKGRNHWVTLVVDYKNREYKSYYADSFGYRISEDINSYLIKNSITNVKNVVHTSQQYDGYNCGFWAIQNAFNINYILNSEYPMSELLDNDKSLEDAIAYLDNDHRLILESTHGFKTVRELFRTNIEDEIIRKFNEDPDENPLNKRPKLTPIEDPGEGPSRAKDPCMDISDSDRRKRSILECEPIEDIPTDVISSDSVKKVTEEESEPDIQELSLSKLIKSHEIFEKQIDNIGLEVSEPACSPIFFGRNRLKGKMCKEEETEEIFPYEPLEENVSESSKTNARLYSQIAYLLALGKPEPTNPNINPGNILTYTTNIGNIISEGVINHSSREQELLQDHYNDAQEFFNKYSKDQILDLVGSEIGLSSRAWIFDNGKHSLLVSYNHNRYQLYSPDLNYRKSFETKEGVRFVDIELYAEAFFKWRSNSIKYDLFSLKENIPEEITTHIKQAKFWHPDQVASDLMLLNKGSFSHIEQVPAKVVRELFFLNGQVPELTTLHEDFFSKYSERLSLRIEEIHNVLPYLTEQESHALTSLIQQYNFPVNKGYLDSIPDSNKDFLHIYHKKVQEKLKKGDILTTKELSDLSWQIIEDKMSQHPDISPELKESALKNIKDIHASTSTRMHAMGAVTQTLFFLPDIVRSVNNDDYQQLGKLGGMVGGDMILNKLYGSLINKLEPVLSISRISLLKKIPITSPIFKFLTVHNIVELTNELNSLPADSERRSIIKHQLGEQYFTVGLMVVEMFGFELGPLWIGLMAEQMIYGAIALRKQYHLDISFGEAFLLNLGFEKQKLESILTDRGLVDINLSLVNALSNQTKTNYDFAIVKVPRVLTSGPQAAGSVVDFTPYDHPICMEDNVFQKESTGYKRVASVVDEDSKGNCMVNSPLHIDGPGLSAFYVNEKSSNSTMNMLTINSTINILTIFDPSEGPLELKFTKEGLQRLDKLHGVSPYNVTRPYILTTSISRKPYPDQIELPQNDSYGFTLSDDSRRIISGYYIDGTISFSLKDNADSTSILFINNKLFNGYNSYISGSTDVMQVKSIYPGNPITGNITFVDKHYVNLNLNFTLINSLEINVPQIDLLYVKGRNKNKMGKITVKPGVLNANMILGPNIRLSVDNSIQKDKIVLKTQRINASSLVSFQLLFSSYISYYTFIIDDLQPVLDNLNQMSRSFPRRINFNFVHNPISGKELCELFNNNAKENVIQLKGKVNGQIAQLKIDDQGSVLQMYNDLTKPKHIEIIHYNNTVVLDNDSVIFQKVIKPIDYNVSYYHNNIVKRTMLKNKFF